MPASPSPTWDQSIGSWGSRSPATIQQEPSHYRSGSTLNPSSLDSAYRTPVGTQRLWYRAHCTHSPIFLRTLLRTRKWDKSRTGRLLAASCMHPLLHAPTSLSLCQHSHSSSKIPDEYIGRP